MFKIEFTSWGLSKFPNDFDKNYVIRMVQDYNTVDATVTFLSYLVDIMPDGTSLKISQLCDLIKTGFLKEGVISI